MSLDAAANAGSLKADDLLGPYVLVRKVGRGAFGEVWLARHHDLAGRYALKVPTDPQYVRLLGQEGRAICGLAHPNVVKGVDVNTLHDPAYLVMEFVDGTTLRER